MNQSQVNKFLITRKVFLYETPFPTIVNKGVNKAVFHSRDEAENFVATAEEKAFKSERLYMILKNEDNAVRIGKELLERFKLNLYKGEYLDYDFKIPENFNSEQIAEIKQIFSEGFYDIWEIDKTVNGFVIATTTDLGDSDNFRKINPIFDEKPNAEMAILKLIKYQVKNGFGDFKFLMGESLDDLTSKASELETWLKKYPNIFKFEEGYGYSGKRIGYISDEVCENTGLNEIEELMRILEPKIYEIIEL